MGRRMLLDVGFCDHSNGDMGIQPLTPNARVEGRAAASSRRPSRWMGWPAVATKNERTDMTTNEPRVSREHILAIAKKCGMVRVFRRR